MLWENDSHPVKVLPHEVRFYRVMNISSLFTVSHTWHLRELEIIK